jgi:hypothetical protein
MARAAGDKINSMSNKRAVIDAFLVGAIIAGASAYFFYSRQIKELELHHDISSEVAFGQHNIVSSIDILKYLRIGDVTNAIGYCEKTVDNSVISLAWQATESSKYYPFSTNNLAFEDNIAISAIRHAKKYRDKFPYKSGDIYNTDEKVANAFALVNVQTNH